MLAPVKIRSTRERATGVEQFPRALHSVEQARKLYGPSAFGQRHSFT